VVRRGAVRARVFSAFLIVDRCLVIYFLGLLPLFLIPLSSARVLNKLLKF